MVVKGIDMSQVKITPPDGLHCLLGIWALQSNYPFGLLPRRLSLLWLVLLLVFSRHTLDRALALFDPAEAEELLRVLRHQRPTGLIIQVLPRAKDALHLRNWLNCLERLSLVQRLWSALKLFRVFLLLKSPLKVILEPLCPFSPHFWSFRYQRVELCVVEFAKLAEWRHWAHILLTNRLNLRDPLRVQRHDIGILPAGLRQLRRGIQQYLLLCQSLWSVWLYAISWHASFLLFLH